MVPRSSPAWKGTSLPGRAACRRKRASASPETTWSPIRAGQLAGSVPGAGAPTRVWASAQATSNGRASQQAATIGRAETGVLGTGGDHTPPRPRRPELCGPPGAPRLRSAAVTPDPGPPRRRTFDALRELFPGDAIGGVVLLGCAAF